MQPGGKSLTSYSSILLNTYDTIGAREVPQFR
jgi:hypothetical protein